MSTTAILTILAALGGMIALAYLLQKAEARSRERKRLEQGILSRCQHFESLRDASFFPIFSKRLRLLVLSYLEDGYKSLVELHRHNEAYKQLLSQTRMLINEVSQQEIEPKATPRSATHAELAEAKTMLKTLNNYIGRLQQNNSMDKKNADLNRRDIRRVVVQLHVAVELTAAQASHASANNMMELHHLSGASTLLRKENTDNFYDALQQEVDSKLAAIKQRIEDQRRREGEDTLDKAVAELKKKEADGLFQKKQVYDD